MTSLYSQDISGIFSAACGAGGLPEAGFDAVCGEAWAALQRLRREHAEGAPLMRHAFRDEDLPAIEAAARNLSGRGSRILAIGTGGSSLGARTLCATAPARRTIFVENADPDTVARTAASDIAGSAFLAVSKSGATAETLAVFAQYWAAAADALGPAEAAARFLVVTGPQESPLRRLARRHGIEILDHEPDVVGRMAILANVGLLPAAIDGVDVRAVRAGARSVAEQALSAPAAADCPPALGAAMQVALMRERGARASILMPYADRLAEFSLWYCQLWAESLGKAGCGSMPYPALGMVDQHSQLQFWLDGPPVGVYTIVDLPPAEAPPLRFDESGLDWLDGRTLGELMAAAAQSTARILEQNGRPVRRIRLSAARVDAEAVGALAMHFMLETALAGYMLGVDPYSQPAVDAGKALMRDFLSKSGER
ncbi:MAG: glucose-6-phosphate isomerase [Rhodospirillaceae bacterium]|nr:glucose-6-phosphate isomerase [Rhodospirillaceae bacterium]MYB12026.1 glucose-6-phosphate isomerase [Rhodospirillaceae bacterium]MYI49349.1 glucose-6-phosphate isomerase [Rhodospirillaceae bacterium]